MLIAFVFAIFKCKHALYESRKSVHYSVALRAKTFGSLIVPLLSMVHDIAVSSFRKLSVQEIYVNVKHFFVRYRGLLGFKYRFQKTSNEISVHE